MLILGFGNKARNGKDTAAEAIRDYYQTLNVAFTKHGYGLKAPKVGVFKFADALYAEVNEWLKVTTDNGRTEYAPEGRYVVPPSSDNPTMVSIPDWVQPDPNPQKSALAPYGKHPKLLQWWGTEFRRQHFGHDYWVKKIFASIPANLDIALISDVRFVNEAEAIKQLGGYTINVQRLNRDGSQFFSSDRPVNHPSEIALDGYNWDFYLKIPEGHAALTAELAITLAVYLRGLQK